jgi:phosphate transport system substrate-binding protein
MKFRMVINAVGMAVLMTSFSVFAVHTVDESVPSYHPARSISGKLSSVGSDTLMRLMTLWMEEFKHLYPGVTIQIQAAGSSTAPPALTEGITNMAPMSRKMTDKERDAFKNKYGYQPTAIPIAIDALAVYVNKTLPVKGLTMAQVDAIFSSTRQCGYPKDISNWGQVGLTGEWLNRPIQLYGRNSVSGTYGYFKKRALCNGEFKNTVNELPGSAAVIQSVTYSVEGIGYSGIGYKTLGVRAVPLAKKAGGEFVDVTAENVINGKYPLARFLYIYINKPPHKSLPLLEAEFLKMVLSKVGQNIVIRAGFIPLPANIIERVLPLIQTTEH